jgi:outer membrane protein assembly factor BamD (BamD/ComL family)
VPKGLAAIEALPSDAGPEAFLSIVKTEAEAGRTAGALEALDRFRDRFPAGSDEAWWLYGRLLETNGPTKDVKAALGFYKRLVADYPQSSRYDEARKRIAYLERYYFQIR